MIKLKDLLGEAYNPAEAFNKKVSKMTDRNEHSEAAVELAIYLDDRDAVNKLNQIKKDLRNCALAVALCFPDTYEVGMSYGGLAIIYGILNKMDGVAAERVFAPWLDAEQILREILTHKILNVGVRKNFTQFVYYIFQSFIKIRTNYVVKKMPQKRI